MGQALCALVGIVSERSRCLCLLELCLMSRFHASTSEVKNPVALSALWISSRNSFHTVSTERTQEKMTLAQAAVTTKYNRLGGLNGLTRSRAHSFGGWVSKIRTPRSRLLGRVLFLA